MFRLWYIKMKKYLIALMVVTLAGCSGKHFEPFSGRELKTQLAYTMATMIDWKQTLNIVKDDRYYEINPILGKHPSRERVNTLIPLGIAAHWLIAWWLPKEYRATWQGGWLLVETTAIVHNYSVGLGP
jgi:hypothetical protein